MLKLSTKAKSYPFISPVAFRGNKVSCSARTLPRSYFSARSELWKTVVLFVWRLAVSMDRIASPLATGEPADIYWQKGSQIKYASGEDRRICLLCFGVLVFFHHLKLAPTFCKFLCTSDCQPSQRSGRTMGWRRHRFCHPNAEVTSGGNKSAVFSRPK